MKKILLAAVLTVTALNSVMAEDKAKEPAEASRKVDLSTLTCGQFVQMSAPEAITTLSWIDGYLTQKEGKPVWDVDTFVQHRDKLINVCVEDDGKEKLVLEEIQNLN